MSAPQIIAIVAMDQGRVIGNRGQIPWRLPADMRRFAQLTTPHTVLMGRKTFESLPAKYSPLPNRRNLVVTRNRARFVAPSGVEIFDDLEPLLRDIRAGVYQLQGDALWIIGGGEIYRATEPFWDRVELTLVPGTHEGDAFLPHFEDSFIETGRAAGEGCEFVSYERINRPR